MGSEAVKNTNPLNYCIDKTIVLFFGSPYWENQHFERVIILSNVLIGGFVSNQYIVYYQGSCENILHIHNLFS